MGTSQSKRNKISKFRTSSVGTVGELDEQDEDRILNNTGKLSSMKANNNSRNSSETNKKDYTNANNGNNFLQTNNEVSSSQVNFFKMLDEKIENGADLDEEEADRIRKIELLRNVEEWDHVLAKSQTIDSSYTSMLTKTRVSVTSSDNALDNTNSSRQKDLKEDSNKKNHCDEKMQKSSKENERIKRNSSSSNNARSKETKKSAKENGSFTSPYNTSNKQNVTIDKQKDATSQIKRVDMNNSKTTESSASPIKSTSRKPRLKQRENGNIPNNASKASTKQDSQNTSTSKDDILCQSVDSSISKSNSIKSNNSKENLSIDHNNGKTKSKLSASFSSSKHLKDRGKKLN